MPSSLINLNSHLLRRHLFCKSMFLIPSPPTSFGWQMISHLTNLYFFSPSACQKNLDLRYSSFSKTILGTSKKDNMYSERLVRTELMRTNLPPTLTSVCPSSYSVSFQSSLGEYSNHYSSTSCSALESQGICTTFILFHVQFILHVICAQHSFPPVYA